MRRSQVINLVGAICTAVVLVVVFATKIEHGAWLAVAAMIVLFRTVVPGYGSRGGGIS